MARVPYVNKEDLSPEHRELLRSDSNITRALANSPTASHQSGAMAHYIRHGNRLDGRLREMAIIQVGYLTGSAYEYTHHIETGLSFGVTEADIRAIADETAGRPTSLEPLAKAVLRAAREMTDGIAVSDATFAELKKGGLDNERLVDLFLAIANYNGVVRLLASLQVDLEDSYRPYLEKFPLPAK
jgi:alkylhydroperoxidase family enzyme